MNQLVLLPLLLADDERMKSLGSHFRSGSWNFTISDLFLWLGFALGAAFVAWLISRTLYAKERPTPNNPKALFRELCRAHKLDATSRKLLLDLAHAHDINLPARLFVEPERFSAAEPGSAFHSRRAEIDALAARIFGDSAAQAA